MNCVTILWFKLFSFDLYNITHTQMCIYIFYTYIATNNVCISIIFSMSLVYLHLQQTYQMIST